MKRLGLEQQEERVYGPVAWNPQYKLDLKEWVHHGVRLGAIGRGVAWWIGDWVNYGNAKFGEKYVRAGRITGYDVQSLMNMAYVASRFEFSRRRKNLSWSHHAEVAPLSTDEQEYWLNIAVEKRLSVRRLRSELRAWRSKGGAALRPENAASRPTLENSVHDSGNGPEQEQPVPEQTRRELEQRRNPNLHDASVPPHVVCPRCGYYAMDPRLEP